jgi:ABC-2 type transport system permease protein
MLYNMYLSVPVTLFATVTCCISAGVPVLTTVLLLILGFILCAFSTVRGSVCGIKHMRLDWENEIEVIKQGAGTGIYLLTNMIACFVLMGASLALGTILDQNLVALIMIAVVSLMTVLSYKKVMRLAKK